MAYEIKRESDDFIVEEITPEGEVLEVGKHYDFDKESKGNHLVCALQRREWDQNLAIGKISKVLRIARRRIGFAGTKDKFAVACQRISIAAMDYDSVNSVKIKDMEIQPMYRQQNPVMLGDLSGNRFTIKVYSDKKPVQKGRILNKFGVQRFGDKRPITNLVGEQIIRNSPEQAVKIYLTATYGEEDERSETVRKELAQNWPNSKIMGQTAVFRKALDDFPKKMKFERVMLSHLAEYPQDFIGAIRTLPRGLQIMFVHAFQSRLFNDYLEENAGGEDDTAPLFGYEVQLDEKEQAFLKRKGFAPQDFKIKCLPELSGKGERRKIWVELADFEILEQNEDEGWRRIRFSLPKGVYATEVIEQLFS
ncbi:MAG: tRNA pseudouridine(13) synthase TruD [Candidatus Micrarchaeota archaeon]